MSSALYSHLDFTPSADQRSVLRDVEAFLDSGDDLFVLCGAAGTGKTSLTKALVSYLDEKGTSCALAAPTGRAARVMSGKTGAGSTTLHRMLFTVEPLEGQDAVGIRFKRRMAESGGACVYIVDEASMVSAAYRDQEHFKMPGALLDELVRYAKRQNEGSKIIFIGDRYQLPPVDENHSVALAPALLAQRYDLSVGSAELTEVHRQRRGSYILDGAQRIRGAIDRGAERAAIPARRLPHPYVNVERYLAARDEERHDAAVMLAWTNKDVNWMNQRARKELGYGSTTLMAGEPVVVNRSWTGDQQWIPNGEHARIVSTGSVTTYADLRFMPVSIAVEGLEEPIQSLALLDVLTSKFGGLTSEQEKRLVHQAIKDNPVFRETRRASDDKYVGALRLRYGYALTVHKAQGGEWDKVYLHPYFARDLRWRYTALTRAREEVYSYEHLDPKYRFIDFVD